MSGRFWNSEFGANIKAAVIGWAVTMVCTLLLAALLLVLSALTSESDGFASALVLVAIVAGLAVLFLAGFVCSRFAASRSAVWMLIALLLLPSLVQNRWGNPWVTIHGTGGLPMDGLDVVVGVVGTVIGGIFAWVVGILPVVAGANYEERRRIASR